MNKKKLLIIIMLLIFSFAVKGVYSYFNNDKTISRNLSLKNEINVKLDANQGTFESNATITLTDGIVSLPVPKRKDYSFLGYQENSGSHKEYSLQANLSDINHKTLSAMWTYNIIPISYDLKGGHWNELSSDQPTKDFDKTEKREIKFISPVREGYEFLGWTGPTLDEPTIEPTILSDRLYEEASNGNKLLFIAHWKERDYYTITYDLGGIGSWPNGYKPLTKYRYDPNDPDWMNFRLLDGMFGTSSGNGAIGIPLRMPVLNQTNLNFLGWQSNTGTFIENVGSSINWWGGTTGEDLHFKAIYGETTYNVDVNSIIHNTVYYSGLASFTFSVWVNDVLVADRVTDFNQKLVSGSKLRIYVHDREGYSMIGFRDQTWTVTSDLVINPVWYDNIPPTIVDFRVENLGYYNPRNKSKGWNIHVYINGFDNGTGLQKYQTWLVPYKEGSGSGRKDGGDRIMTNVIRLQDSEGRTFCAYAIDWAGNESSKCMTIKV